MNRSHFARLPVAAFAAFAFSAVYYGAFVGPSWQELAGLSNATAEMSVWQPIAQLLRNLIVAAALAFILGRASVRAVLSGIGLALVLWAGFQAMAIAGSIIHEHYPVELYLIHTADQLATIVIMAVCLTVRRGSRRDVRPLSAGGI